MRKTTPPTPIHTDQEGHEGARESTKPGEPVGRDVITPDWEELEKKPEHGEVKPKTAPPAIDRHR